MSKKKVSSTNLTRSTHHVVVGGVPMRSRIATS